MREGMAVFSVWAKAAATIHVVSVSMFTDLAVQEVSLAASKKEL